MMLIECMTMDVDRGGRSRKTWGDCVQGDVKRLSLSKWMHSLEN